MSPPDHQQLETDNSAQRDRGSELRIFMDFIAQRDTDLRLFCFAAAASGPTVGKVWAIAR